MALGAKKSLRAHDVPLAAAMGSNANKSAHSNKFS